MAKTKKKFPGSLIKNRIAFHTYEILDTYEAGIELQGTEVKSCRAGKIVLQDAFAKIENGEVILMNAHIAEYDHGNRFNHKPKRQRRLLLHKYEIRKLRIMTREKGLSLVPLGFHLKNGKIKVGLGVGRGKTSYDKRETLKKKQDNMDAKRALSKFK